MTGYQKIEKRVKKKFNNINKLRAIDNNVSYRRGLFKVNGSLYRVNEIENILTNPPENFDKQNEKFKQLQKKRKTEEKLKEFEFRPRSSSLSGPASGSAL